LKNSESVSERLKIIWYIGAFPSVDVEILVGFARADASHSIYYKMPREALLATLLPEAAVVATT
jgi:hypothetical protein